MRRRMQRHSSLLSTPHRDMHAPSPPTLSWYGLLAVVVIVSLLAGSGADAQLWPEFYATSCPKLQGVVRSVMAQAVRRDPRMGASILRLFFHDCFVNGCDASVLLDDTPTMAGEKNSGGNANSLLGYEVIDAIKARVEATCRSTVSCADILALAARDAVNLLGGPAWTVPLGRRDARWASMAAANANLPPASAGIDDLVARFAAKGLSLRDLTALSGAHTVGAAKCSKFRRHVYNDSNVDPAFAMFRRRICPAAGGDARLAPLDSTSPNRFDVSYYRDLMARRGLLHSDQELFNNGPADELVRLYGANGNAFDRDFAAAMVKMGGISPLTGGAGEIRINCRKSN
ncbi:peroxidase P7-like isoform X2 [Zingiber officinale]|uniref:peroxidase P7-like isoform X2 n=1 Tax=Zingiber officinale TaxID=94328 RepID=UPI001C4ADA90|nr:peroxidase P7-like isoform X2 [Zingiber officinale]